MNKPSNAKRAPTRKRMASLALTAAVITTTTGAVVATTTPASAASTGPTLVVYSAQGYDSAETTAFQKATGIPVTLDDDSTGPLLEKVEAEKNNPKWGLLWVDGATAFALLDEQDLLMKGWEPMIDWNAQGKAAVPADKSYVPTGLTMAGTMVYEPKEVPDPPSTWQALLGSKWDNLVGMNDPAVSGPTYPFVAGMMNYLGGVAQGEKYYEGLAGNGLQINLTNGNTLEALEAGIIKIALIQSSAGIGAGLKTHGEVKVKFLKPVTSLPSAIGIDAKAPKAVQAEAEKFVEFVLSAQGQKIMQSGDPTGDSLYWPVVQGVKPLPALPPLSSIPVQNINPYTWGAREETINAWFTDNIIE
ncbi:MAG TPA: extracellular solute-binding protein [Acidimicrobiales bacterium]|nr:extracellular solute-binding protein [Acidimicrobiales bacterium]